MTRGEAIKELERISEDTVQRDCSTCGRHTAGMYNGVCCYCSLCQVVPEIFKDYHERKHFRSHWLWNGKWKNDALDMAISALREQDATDTNVGHKWISVEERLPTPFVSVLVYMPDERPLPTVHEGFLAKEGMWYANHFDREPMEITHWMPLPEPPEEEV